MSRRGGGYVKRGWVLTFPGHGTSGSGYSPQGHGIQRDTVGKRAVRILLECFLMLNFDLLGDGPDGRFRNMAS